MDDFVLSNLQESRNEWCSRLVSIFCPLVVEGIRSIFNESWKICLESGETEKYLMTFQNFLTRIPKWNSVIVEEERKRIIERSGCNYLEDLITCVHIIQLKVLTCIRVGNRQKKIDITIPKLDHFIHKVYIHVARKIYTNVYLFEHQISPLQMQKNARETELIVQECILTTIRESIPTEEIIRAYMDECVEAEEEVTIEPIAEPVVTGSTEDGEVAGGAATETTKIPSIVDDMPVTEPKVTDMPQDSLTVTSFQELDAALDARPVPDQETTARTIERLGETVASQALVTKLAEDAPLNDSLRIHTDKLHMGVDDLGIVDLDAPAEPAAFATAAAPMTLAMLGMEEI